ncbi:YwdI family protein [Metabacillus sp. RGM 3146]|uniref:YwdI family protein n=1 Tax=Metabacillus sp. RGM 3146 TaxID=3401092 RepID=UPI003B9A66B8
MDIPLQALLRKMEEELQKAKSAADGKAVRDHMLIIQSLCDVVLDQNQKQPNLPLGGPFPSIEPKQESISSWELQKMMGQTKSVPEEKGKKDTDGNGDSIFDF